jgi:hypothetical protein
VNAGRFVKAAGSADLQTLDVPMTNTGTIRVESGTLVANGFPTNNGIIDLATGTTFSTAGAPLTNGTLALLKGNGTLAASLFTNNGTVSPGDSPGTLTIAGDYVQGPLGTLVAELGGTRAGADYDLLRITGSAVLDGALRIEAISGAPIAEGASFQFMTYASARGDFAVFSIPAGSTLRALPGPAGYQIVAAAPPVVPPEPVAEPVITAAEANRIAQVTAVAQKDAVVAGEKILKSISQGTDTAGGTQQKDADGECR